MHQKMVLSYKGDENEQAEVGKITDDVYITRRYPEHFFRIFQGFGLSIKIYNELVDKGVSKIRIYYINNGVKIYDSDLSQWKNSNVWNNNINESEKVDPQYILPLAEMKETRFDEMKGGNLKMVILDNYTKMSGSFLKAEDIKKAPSAPFTITGEGQMVKSEKFGNERLHIEGMFNGEEKVFDCSKTNARFIEKILGSDTKKWISHLVYFEVYRTKTTAGSMTDALNVSKVQ